MGVHPHAAPRVHRLGGGTIKVANKVAIVTGASMGIGEATVRALVVAGARLVLAARSAQRLAALADELNAQGTGSPRALAIPTDVGDEQAVQHLVAQTIEQWGRVDILVNNAGLGLYGPLAEAETVYMRRLMDVNYFGALAAVRAVVPQMKAQGGGTIVNVSSIVGKHVTPYQGAYSATKYALIAASDALRIELAPFGITVITVLPGVTHTMFQENALRQGMAPPSRRGLRGVAPNRVGRAIVAAIERGGPPEVYVTLFDRAYVAFATLFPRLTDRILLLILKHRQGAHSAGNIDDAH